jgi:hypothetical protein
MPGSGRAAAPYHERQRRLLERARATAAERVPPDIQEVPDDFEVAVSPLQQRLWFLQQLSPQTPIYQSALCFDVAGALRPADLAAALSLLVARHDALRTCIRQRPDGAAVLLPAPAEPEPCEVEVTGDPERAVEDFCRRPFRLADERPFRALVVPTGSDRHTFVMAMHHVAYDRQSLAILTRDLRACFAHVRDGAAVPPPPPVSYRAYARWMASELTEEIRQRQTRYWVTELTGLPHTTDLPTDRPRPEVPDFRGGLVSLHLDATTAGRVRTLAATAGTTTFVVLVSAYLCLLHRLSDDTAVAAGTPLSSRPSPRLENVVGAFVNTVAIRTDFAPQVTFLDVVTSVAGKVPASLDNGAVPFESVVAALDLPRQMAYNPVFQTMFQYTPGASLALELPGLRCRTIEQGPEVSVMDLAWYLTDGPDGVLSGWLSFSRALFDETSAEILAGEFAALVHGLVDRPGGRVGTARVDVGV